MDRCFTLEETLQKFLDWLTRIGLVPPPTKGIKIHEFGRPGLVDPVAYATRFTEITHARHSWINVECLGIQNDYLIFAIRLPNPEFEDLLRPGDPTTVNGGGPERWVLHSNWQLPADYFLGR